jgi:hypothetical protein
MHGAIGFQRLWDCEPIPALRDQNVTILARLRISYCIRSRFGFERYKALRRLSRNGDSLCLFHAQNSWPARLQLLCSQGQALF